MTHPALKDLQDAKDAIWRAETKITTPSDWSVPVGTLHAPVEEWYTASVHDVRGYRNSPDYPHTGIDLNWEKPPRGNVDVGQPVRAVADGVVTAHSFSDRFRGSIIIKVDHFGLPLWIRYWHIMNDSTFREYEIGSVVEAGEILGHIDYYPNGYAHLHLDGAWMEFQPHWWFLYHPEIEWVNIAWVLRQHLGSELIDAMLRLG